MAKVFFSYCHKDEDLRDRLEVHLSMLKREGAIESWHDRRIAAGSELDGAISDNLEAADLILLLVSPDFLNSSYCYDREMMRAMERHESGDARVIPIILHHCDWHSAPFGKLLATPRDGKPIVSWADHNEALLDVVKMIRQALPKQTGSAKSPPAKSDKNPAVTTSASRSSNLRLKKTFTEADKERFTEEGFEFMVRFFEASLEELKARNPGIETSFRRIDANTFTSVIYINGEAKARCKIRLGGMRTRDITFSFDDKASNDSMNESLSVKFDDQSLFFECSGLQSFGDRSSQLSFEGGSELYWELFIRNLQ